MTLTALLAAVLLLLINGFFTSVELSLTASRRPTLETMARSGNRFAGWALAAMNELPVTFAGAQLGIAASSLSLGFLIEASFEAGFESLYLSLGLPPGTIPTLAVVTALLVMTFVHNVFGDMAPKNVAIAAPERTALIVAAPFRAYVTLLRPIILALSWVAGAVLRAFGIRTSPTVEITHSAEDIAALLGTIGSGEVIDPSSARLLGAALRLRNTLVSEVMVPRPDLVAMPLSATASSLERTMVSTGHSRIPVYGDDLDDIRGYVHAKDLLTMDAGRRDRPVGLDLIRGVPVVPETASISPVLEMMRSGGSHLALVVDEHGGVAGLITLEDIAEELVGDIRDEHDIREVMEVRPAGRDRYLVAGQTRVDRMAELGAPLPEGDYETVGGYLMARLGRVPEHGDSVSEDHFEMTVRRMEGRRVREVEVRLLARPPSPGGD